MKELNEQSPRVSKDCDAEKLEIGMLRVGAEIERLGKFTNT